ncbi:hypothetical protein IWW45_007663 [Coemansia sp. RSA 485]|nr:hypothetical protein IWW45_007663 [Coemansia sp. RSA 485]
MSAGQFNGNEIQGYISSGWLDAQDKLSNPRVSDKEKPQLYKGGSQTKDTSASAMGYKKGSTMANQKDFLDELRRQLREMSQ